MNKAVPAVALTVAAIAVIIGAYVFTEECVPGVDPDCPTNTQHDAVRSGPLAITQYDHRLGENVFFLVRGLQPHESGSIGVFTPQGTLYLTIPYDGSIKPDFNRFFFPDTAKYLSVCTPEDLVGTWQVVFDNGAYPPLEFQIRDEYIIGGEKNLQTVC